MYKRKDDTYYVYDIDRAAALATCGLELADLVWEGSRNRVHFGFGDCARAKEVSDLYLGGSLVADLSRFRTEKADLLRRARELERASRDL